ncbi:MAG: Dabb family protein, partial [Christensenellaceae bacterium]|nr:Dabb family protein [Christensenellaceae bacterium]
QALERYKNHPEHKKVSAFVKEVRLSRTAVDYII